MNGDGFSIAEQEKAYYEEEGRQLKKMTAQERLVDEIYNIVWNLEHNSLSGIQNEDDRLQAVEKAKAALQCEKKEWDKLREKYNNFKKTRKQ